MYFLNYTLKKYTEENVIFDERNKIPSDDFQILSKLSECKYIEFARVGYDRKILRINLGKRVYKYGRMCTSSQLLPIYYVSFEYEFDGDCCFPLSSEPIDDKQYNTIQ